eukprot:scaffold1151_cov126-Isochrysis_galbana.AAC.1
MPDVVHAQIHDSQEPRSVCDDWRPTLFTAVPPGPSHEEDIKTDTTHTYLECAYIGHRPISGSCAVCTKYRECICAASLPMSRAPLPSCSSAPLTSPFVVMWMCVVMWWCVVLRARHRPHRRMARALAKQFRVICTPEYMTSQTCLSCSSRC